MAAVLSLLAISSLCLIGSGRMAPAQESRITAHDIDRAENFDAAQGFGRLQTDLIYIDQLEGEIPMDGAPRYEPPKEPAPRAETGNVRAGNQVLMGLFLAILVWVLWKYGRPIMERFGFTPREIKRKAREDGNEVGEAPLTREPDLIARLRNATDREAALVELIGAVLTQAAAANGLRLTRSETARELLRRLPGSWPHLADLRRIVMTEELVQFGGRPLEERSFFDCLDRAGRILKAQPA